MESASATGTTAIESARESLVLLPPLTSLQRQGLLAFLVLSGVDVVLSTYLFFGSGGQYVELNPVLAWATGSLSLFLMAVLGTKAIGAVLLALLASFGNRFCRLAGDAVVISALCTTTALFLIQTVTLGGVSAVV